MQSSVPHSEITQIGPLLDFEQMKRHFHIGRNNAYYLAAAGEITSLTLGSPKNPGKRVFLMSSVVDYVNRRIANSPILHAP